jgi:polysaccharide biosynthesis transport protein
MSDLLPYLSDRSLSQGIRREVPYRPAASPSEAGIGLWDCWTIIKSHWRVIAVVLIGALSITTAAVLLATPNFAAYVILQIDPEAPRILDMNQLLEQIQNAEDHDYYKTQFELLESEELAAQVIHDLNLEAVPLFNGQRSKGNAISQLYLVFETKLRQLISTSEPSRSNVTFLNTSKAAIDSYLARVVVEPIVGTRLVRVSFKSPDAVLSARIANTHVKDFLLLSQNLRRQAGEAARSFLEQELVETKAKIEKSEAELNAYRNRRGILAFGINDQEKNRIAEQRMVELNTALTDAQSQRIKAEAQLEVVKAGDFESLPAVVSNPMIQNLRPEVDRLQAEYAELASKYRPKYPPLREAKARLEAAKARLTAEDALIARAVKRNYNAAVARENELQQQIAVERQRDRELNAVSLQDAILVREVETNRQLYHDVLQRAHEISVDNDAPLANVSIVEPAQVPPYASSPKKLKILAIAGLLAMVIGVGLSFVLEQCDDRLKSVEEIETYLHLPELGVVPDFGKLGHRGHVSSLAAALSADAHDINARTKSSNGRSSSFSALEHRMSFYKSIRSAILYSRAGGAPRTILFASALPSEGKTMTAVSTALAFAHTGAGTVLIDADLRAPRCHKLLDTHNEVGLSDIIVNRAQPGSAIRRMDDWHLHDYEGLYLLGAGPRVPNPGELLTSVKMHQVLQHLAEFYQFILLDSAPIMCSSETVGLATMVDGVVVVADANTSKQVIRSSCKRLTAAGATVFGVVLNKVDVRRPVYHRLYPDYGVLERSYPALEDRRSDTNDDPIST